MCKRLDFPKSPFTPSRSSGAVFQHPSLLSGDQLTGRSPPCLRCCQSCFPPHLTGDTCEFTQPLWEVRVSLNSFTSVGPGRYKPATLALSSFLHHAVFRNSPFPSISPLCPWGENRIHSQQLFRMHFGSEWICSLISVLLGKEGSGALESWALTREKPPSDHATSLELHSLGDDCSSSVFHPGPS